MKIIKAIPKLVALFFVVVVIVDLGQLLISIISPWQPEYIIEKLFIIASNIAK